VARVWVLEYYDPNFDLIADVSMPATFGASISCFATWGVGMQAANAGPDSNSNQFQTAGCPELVLLPGSHLWAKIQGSVGGDRTPGVFTGGPYAQVTRYYYGSAAAAPPVAQTGPFMFVPGPGAAGAASQTAVAA
jgi:hypothetical protein